MQAMKILIMPRTSRTSTTMGRMAALDLHDGTIRKREKDRKRQRKKKRERQRQRQGERERDRDYVTHTHMK